MKKLSMIVSSIVLCIALALTVLASVLLPCSIAYAASEKDVVLATISNLEGNEYPVASTIELMTSDSEKFLIPESYYVTDVKLYLDGYYSVVKYCDKEFYCLTSSLPSKTKVTFDDGVSPYPDITLALKNGEMVLNGITITNDYTVKFLGYHTSDSAQIFVVATYNGKSHFGFAQKDAFTSFVVPYHPIAQAERIRIIESKKPVEPKGGDIVPNTSLALRIVLIIGIAIPAVIIVVLLFKPSKNDTSSGKNQLRRARKKDEFDYDSSRSYSPDRPYDDRNEYKDGNYERNYDNRAGRNYNDRGRDFDNRYDK